MYIYVRHDILLSLLLYDFDRDLDLSVPKTFIPSPVPRFYEVPQLYHAQTDNHTQMTKNITYPFC